MAQVIASDTSGPFSFSWDTSALVGTTATSGGGRLRCRGELGVFASSNGFGYERRPARESDTTPPVATIASPANGSRVSGKVSVNASATDNVAVASITLSIDGAKVATSNGAAINYKWNARKVTSGTHTISVLARDTSGNQATRTIQVSK